MAAAKAVGVVSRETVVNGKVIMVKVIPEGHHGRGYFANKAAFKASYEDEALALQRDIIRAQDREIEAEAGRWGK